MTCRYALVQEPGIWRRECGIPIAVDEHEQRSASQLYIFARYLFQGLLTFQCLSSVPLNVVYPDPAGKGTMA